MAASHRSNMLSAIAGRATDRLPWAPRLDLWYKANRLAGSLPEGLTGAGLFEITDALDAGFTRQRAAAFT